MARSVSAEIPADVVHYVPETSAQLVAVQEALWGINLRKHRSDEAFRDKIHKMREEAAELLRALEEAANDGG